jgi:hypothetical protein
VDKGVLLGELRFVNSLEVEKVGLVGDKGLLFGEEELLVG